MTSYSACKHTTRTKPEITADHEKAKEISQNYWILPLFEAKLIDSRYTKHYSMLTNEYLRCRWEVFKDSITTRHRTPFEFYDKRDEHFYLCDTRIMPAQSLHKNKNFRNKLRPGPGVDSKGQLPIAEELYTRNFRCIARKYPKRYPKKVEDERKEK